MADFDQLYMTAADLMEDLKWDEVRPVMEAAQAAARTPGQRALTQHGMAWLSFEPKDKTAFSELLEKAIAQAEAALQIDPNDSPARLAAAEAWHDKSQFVLRAGEEEKQLALINVILDRFLETACRIPRDPYDRLLRRVMARVLSHKAFELQFINDRESLASYDDFMNRFGNVDDSWLTPIVARAAVWRALVLATLGRTDQQIAGLDDVIARYDRDGDGHIREIVIDAREQRLLAYRDQEDFPGALEACDELLERYAGDTRDRMIDAMARTLIRKGDVLNKLGKVAQELGCYDRVITTWAEDESWVMRKHAAEALLAKAVTLNEADQAGAEMECYDELVRRYENDEDEIVRAVAADALVHKGLSLRAIAEDAAEDTGILETDGEIACYDRVIERYGAETSHGMRRALSAAHFHKGESLLETGRRAEAVDCFDEVIAHPPRAYDPYLEELVDEATRLRREC